MKVLAATQEMKLSQEDTRLAYVLGVISGFFLISVGFAFGWMMRGGSL